MAASFLIWASSVGLLAWQCAGASNQQGGEQSSHAQARVHGKKFIAGVPVYNYHRAKTQQGPRSISLLELDREEAKEWEVGWNLVMKKTTTRDGMRSLCKGAGGGCVFEGNPETGLPVLALRLSEQRLEALLGEGGSQDVIFVEPDMDVYPIPDQPVDKEKDDDEDEGEGEGEGEEPGPQPAPLAAGSSAAPIMAWGQQRIGASTSHLTGRGVNVYVVDTGVRTTHLDLGSRAIPAYEVNDTVRRECKGDLNCAVDDGGHGSHCAGIIAGTKYGTAPGATIHGVKVLWAHGGKGSWILAALDWIKTSGARPAVVSMSLGGEGRSEAYQAGIDDLTEAGIPVVVAAGNEADDACEYHPAHVTSAITVGATNRLDLRASYSNYGRCVDIYAPGSNIMSLSNEGDNLVTKKSGTSMACPHVAGAVALIFQELGNQATVREVRERLMATTQEEKVDKTTLTPHCPNKLLHASRSKKKLVVDMKGCVEYLHTHFESSGCDWAICQVQCNAPGGAYRRVCEAWFGARVRTAAQCKAGLKKLYVTEPANTLATLGEGQCAARGDQACDALAAVAVGNAPERR